MLKVGVLTRDELTKGELETVGHQEKVLSDIWGYQVHCGNFERGRDGNLVFSPLNGKPLPSQYLLPRMLLTGSSKERGVFRLMTEAEVRALVQGCRYFFLANDGRARELKITSLKTWVRKPDIEVRYQYGLYEFGSLSLAEAMKRLLVREDGGPEMGFGLREWPGKTFRVLQRYDDQAVVQVMGDSGLWLDFCRCSAAELDQQKVSLVDGGV